MANDDWHHVQKRLAKVKAFAGWMDDKVALPGTKIRFGIDSVLGLVTGVGDLATAVAGTWIVVEAIRLGVPKSLAFKMMINLLIDFAGGSIPIVGDLFDVAWKANRKNAVLLERFLTQKS